MNKHFTLLHLLNLNYVLYNKKYIFPPVGIVIL